MPRVPPLNTQKSIMCFKILKISQKKKERQATSVYSGSISIR